MSTTWYAVVTELTPETTQKNDQFGKNPKTGKTLRVDIENNKKIYAVAFKAGSSLFDLAVEKAKKYGGKVIPVESDYMFNTSDIDLTLL